jgi:NADP-dependent aldehyde dehydrogenase
MTTPQELTAITTTASRVAPIVAAATDVERAAWLEAVAGILDAHVDELVRPRR